MPFGDQMRAAHEALADKVASTERKDAVPSAKERQKQEETKQEHEHALVAYRRACLDYAQTVTRMDSERRLKVMRQIVGLWLSSRSQTKSVEQMQAELEPLVRNVMQQLDAGEPLPLLCIGTLF